MTAVPVEPGSLPGARALALVLVQVLALGLPDPGYITIDPEMADTPEVSSIDFQFNGDREIANVREWAEWFDVPVTSSDDEDSGRCWVMADFTYLGVVFHVYAGTARDDT